MEKLQDGQLWGIDGTSEIHETSRQRNSDSTVVRLWAVICKVTVGWRFESHLWLSTCRCVLGQDPELLPEGLAAPPLGV